MSVCGQAQGDNDEICLTRGQEYVGRFGGGQSEAQGFKGVERDSLEALGGEEGNILSEALLATWCRKSLK